MQLLLFVCLQNQDLYDASDRGDVEEVEKLLSQGADVNYRDLEVSCVHYIVLLIYWTECCYRLLCLYRKE